MFRTKSMVLGFLFALVVHLIPTAAEIKSVLRSQPLVRRVRAASADNIINVHDSNVEHDSVHIAKIKKDQGEYVEIGAGGDFDSMGVGKKATSKEDDGDEEGRRADVSTNTAIVMQGSDASNSSIRKTQGETWTFQTCVDQASRRRSGRTCKQLSGQDGHSSNLCMSKKSVPKWNYKANEAADTCCGTCSVAPVNVLFGGNMRSVSPMGGLNHPEQLKFLQCRGSACQPCATATNCWAGMAGGYRLDISVAAGHTFSHYRAVAFTDCPVGGQAWWRLNVKKLVNGYVMVYKNNVHSKTLKAKSKTPWKSAMRTGSNKLQIDFHPQDSSKNSEAQVRMAARKVNVQFEQCIDGKSCLKVFGDGSAAGLAMRNFNTNQIDCLDGRPMRAQLRSKCDDWLKCLKGGAVELSTHSQSLISGRRRRRKKRTTHNRHTKKHKGGKRKKMKKTSRTKRTRTITATAAQPQVMHFLRALMHAARVHEKSGESKLVQDSMLGQLQKPEQCTDPAEADAEAFQCECMDQLMEKCGGVDEECFHEAMCADDGVCQTWKDENCASSISALGTRRSLLAARSTHQEKRRSATISDNSGSRTQAAADTSNAAGLDGTPTASTRTTRAQVTADGGVLGAVASDIALQVRKQKKSLDGSAAGLDGSVKGKCGSNEV